MTKFSGWGRTPAIDAEHILHTSLSQLEKLKDSAKPFIPRGLGRSYGDSALAANILDCTPQDTFLRFDASNGILECSAGVSLDRILEVFVPRGWFLPVTPGTKFVTVGGAIAGDVHGKNHHSSGCFSQHVLEFEIWTPAKGSMTCLPKDDLFKATCGGMGLTGVIISAKIQLIPIQSALIDQHVIKAESLKESLELFEEHRESLYSVAWIDCLASGKALGRSILMLGDHSKKGSLDTGKPAKFGIPIDFPSFMLNKLSIKSFNFLYYNRIRKKEQKNTIHYEPFFYPLDGIHNWNRMYGKGGFTQYQFVIPLSAGIKGMSEILERIAHSGKGSFLAVLKTMGPANNNFLSFPIEGYTLALDFKWTPELPKLLDHLDSIVLDYGGRINLTKDVRMSEATFKKSYPNWEHFNTIRSEFGGNHFFQSLQSERIGLS